MLRFATASILATVILSACALDRNADHPNTGGKSDGSAFCPTELSRPVMDCIADAMAAGEGKTAATASCLESMRGIDPCEGDAPDWCPGPGADAITPYYEACEADLMPAANSCPADLLAHIDACVQEGIATERLSSREAFEACRDRADGADAYAAYCQHYPSPWCPIASDADQAAQMVGEILRERCYPAVAGDYDGSARDCADTGALDTAIAAINQTSWSETLSRRISRQFEVAALLDDGALPGTMQQLVCFGIPAEQLPAGAEVHAKPMDPYQALILLEQFATGANGRGASIDVDAAVDAAACLTEELLLAGCVMWLDDGPRRGIERAFFVDPWGDFRIWFETTWSE